MTGADEVVIWAAIIALFPVVLHLSILGAAPLRPPLETRTSVAERLLFRHLWLLFIANGLLSACAVVFWMVGLTAPAVAAGLLAFPTIVAQLSCAFIARGRYVAEGGRRAGKARGKSRKAAAKKGE